MEDSQLIPLQQLIIIASIHQPSATTFELFDKLILLSRGKTCYFGPVENIKDYFNKTGHPIPAFTNPAEFLLDLVSADFASDKETAQEHLKRIQSAWTSSEEAAAMESEIGRLVKSAEKGEQHLSTEGLSRPALPLVILSLLHRSFIKSYRDVVAYGIRILMYLGK